MVHVLRMGFLNDFWPTWTIFNFQWINEQNVTFKIHTLFKLKYQQNNNVGTKQAKLGCMPAISEVWISADYVWTASISWGTASPLQWKLLHHSYWSGLLLAPKFRQDWTLVRAVRPLFKCKAFHVKHSKEEFSNFIWSLSVHFLKKKDENKQSIFSFIHLA